MKSIEVKTFDTPDETRTFDKGKLELIEFNGRMVGRATLEPGWKWSQSVKPIAQNGELPGAPLSVPSFGHDPCEDGRWHRKRYRAW